MTDTDRPAFTIIELLVTIAIVALVVGILLPVIGEGRRAGRQAVCASNLRQFGIATQTYNADFQDRIFAFTWRPGDELPSMYPDLQTAAGQMQASMCQAVDILRRRADRPDMPRIGWWIPTIYYSHLVLQDYLSQELPHPMAACPEDWRRIRWQVDPDGRFDRGAWLPDQPRPGYSNRRWPYSASYQLVPAAYNNPPAPFLSLRQSDVHNRYYVPAAMRFGDLRISGVTFASSKVQMFDMFDRHSARGLEMFYANDQARQPLLFFDGSVRVGLTADADQGWDPWRPDEPQPSVFEYAPPEYEPRRTRNPEIVTGRYQWTRADLRGVDYP